MGSRSSRIPWFVNHGPNPVKMPNIASGHDNQWLVTWAGPNNLENEPFTQNKIYGQFVASNGTLLGDDFEVSSSLKENGSRYQKTEPRSIALENDNYLVVYSQGAYLRGQVISKNGQKIGGDIEIGLGNDPSPILMEDGNIFVTWATWHPSNSGYDVFGRFFDQNGTSVSEQFEINDTKTVWGSHVNSPKVAELSDGNLVVVWHSGTEILARIIAPGPSISQILFHITIPCVQ